MMDNTKSSTPYVSKTKLASTEADRRVHEGSRALDMYLHLLVAGSMRWQQPKLTSVLNDLTIPFACHASAFLKSCKPGPRLVQARVLRRNAETSFPGDGPSLYGGGREVHHHIPWYPLPA